MRVTTQGYTNLLIEQLNRLGARQVALQAQAATGQRVSRPEDDPLAAAHLLEMQSERRATVQFGRNIEAERHRATASFSAIKALKRISDRAGEIATLADELKSPADLAQYGSEVDQLIREALQLANTRHNGGYLFAGTRSDQPAFAAVVSAAGTITTVRYQGNESVPEIEIAEGRTLTGASIGANLGGGGPKGLLQDQASGADFFEHLLSLRDHLLAGNTTAIADKDRANLARDEEALLFHISQNGLAQARLQAASQLHATRVEEVDARATSEVGADLAQTLAELSATTTAYQAALQSSAQIMRLSLMDYLR
jgi:flagellar hook-associated protein 3 FlgL